MSFPVVSGTDKILHSLTSDLAYSEQYGFVTATIANRTPSAKKIDLVKYQRKLLTKFYNVPVEQKYTPDTPPFPVDVVFTWVDDTKEHADRRQQWLTQGSIPKYQHSHNDEIRSAIRSVYQFAPWVRCIFIVADDHQFPQWLAHNSATAPIPVLMVPHSVLYKENFRDHLPTFNSNSIECHLHNIPNLTDKFLYFHDDMFLGNYTQWSDFFTAQGLPKYTLEALEPANPTTRLLDRVFYEVRRRRIHQVCALLKSTCAEVWQEPTFQKYLLKTSAAKFRDSSQLDFITLVVHWNRYKQKSAVQSVTHTFTELNDTSLAEKNLSALLQQRPVLFCINDTVVQRRKMQAIVLRTFLSAYFPLPSAVES
jgi:hypothetical protein